MNIKDLLNEDAKKILGEESLDAIQTAIEEKVKGAVTMALEEQDTLLADKLKTLVENIDKDHSTKLQRVIKAVDRNNASKLVSLSKQFNREMHVESKKFKSYMIGAVDAYLDEFLEECVSTKDLQEAVDNKSAYLILANLRDVLGVDSAFMEKHIQHAVMDGKGQIDKLKQENTEIKNAFKGLYESNQKIKKDLFLEQRISKYPENKQKFVKKALADKPLEFIEENFEYTVRLFDKEEKKRIVSIKEEALENRKVKPDFVKIEKIITENVNNNEDAGVDLFVSELEKVRKF